MILTQRKTIRNKAKALGFDPDIAFRIEEELRRQSALASTKSTQSKDRQGFTQGEVMQLLHYLREELMFTSRMKTELSNDAPHFWSQATPETEEGKDAFNTFSYFRKQYKKYKQKEKTLVSLITKLKGMK